VRKYKVVDAFAARPFKGNPVAVVLDAEGLSDTDMQDIARWTNLSETTFLLPPTDPAADYRLRIFTPRAELPFAGHPTLGSAHAVLEAGRAQARDGILVQECAHGLVRLTIDGAGPDRTLAFDLPDAAMKPLVSDEVDELEAILGAPVVREAYPAIVDVGAKWVVAQIANADALLAIDPDLASSAKFEQRLGVAGVSLFGDCTDGDADIEVRSFAPSSGIAEDPVCGSGNGSIAVFRIRNGMIGQGAASYVAAQGRMVGREGRIAVSIDGNGAVRIGGACVTCVEGMLLTE